MNYFFNEIRAISLYKFQQLKARIIQANASRNIDLY